MTNGQKHARERQKCRFKPGKTLNRLFFQDQQLQRLRGGAVKRTAGGQLQQSVRQGGLQRLSVHGEHFSLLSMSTVTVFL